MGDPRKLKTKWESPRKQWDTERITEESKLVSEYGLKNVKELWIALAQLKQLRREARSLLSIGESGQTKSAQIIAKLQKLGIGKDVATLDQILTLEVRDFLERRLQTRVLKRGLARTPSQARQLITHGFISVNGRKTSSPSFVVPASLDATIAYYKPISIEVAQKSGKKQESAKGAEAEGAPTAPQEAPSAEAEKPQ